MRKFKENKLVIATHNSGKAREISDLLKPYIEKFHTAAELDLPEPEETARTFTGNASIKAVAAAKGSGMPALADDSGLAVTALNGEPGIFSARWAPNKDFNIAMAEVNRRLGKSADRSAAFICALAIAWPDGHVETFEGRIDGNLIWPPRGEKGFGYDPIFIPEGETRTYAEITPEEKSATSHRARAFAKLVEQCLTQK
ncbi:MAG: RdgB/HAM1 family non-canonical purine NTP pyrophosphatase [Alphaproteobacteria bacterium PRO2]|nr:RdgB/HAM1 family non-canonical purine NTP pyrophosphatase [Alphaproteobacteria bacterium PRO2]